jgi:hypothetical protein
MAHARATVLSSLRPAAVGRTAGSGANVLRLAYGGYFLAMAGVNLAVTLPGGATAYRGLAQQAWPGFDWVVEHLVQPVAFPFTAALVVWEVGVGLAVLSKGWPTRVGLLVSLVQLVALAPFLGWYELPNVATAVLVLVLLGRDYDRSLTDVVRSHFGAVGFHGATR